MMDWVRAISDREVINRMPMNIIRAHREWFFEEAYLVGCEGLLRALHSFDEDKSRLYHWVQLKATGAIRDFLGKEVKSRNREASPMGKRWPQTGAIEEPQEKPTAEDKVYAFQLLDSLGERGRRIMSHMAIGGTMKEAAGKEGITQARISQIVDRTRRRLDMESRAAEVKEITIKLPSAASLTKQLSYLGAVLGFYLDGEGYDVGLDLIKLIERKGMVCKYALYKGMKGGSDNG